MAVIVALVFCVLVLIFLTGVIGYFVSVLIFGEPKTIKYYYKCFLNVLEKKDLYKYTFPKMSYEQIVNIMEIPETKVDGCLMDSDMCASANKGEDGILVLYVRKEDYFDSLEVWLHNRRQREKNGIILFVPKSYNDYKKLYNHFCNKGKKLEEDEITNAQIESLQCLKECLHKAQDKSKETLENFQKTNDEIAERVKFGYKKDSHFDCFPNSDVIDKTENPIKFVNTKPLPTKTEGISTAKLVCRQIEMIEEVYYIIRELADKIPVKQMIYYVKKWDEFGFYDWGTNLLFGWFYPEKLPERYKKLIENEDE